MMLELSPKTTIQHCCLRDRQKPLFVQPQERKSSQTLRATPRADHLNLEDDGDIRVLLDRAYPSTSSIRSETARRPATSGGKRSGETRPEQSYPCGRRQPTVKPLSARGGPSSSRREGFVHRPQTAGAAGRIRSLENKKTSPSVAVQRRREILLRSHGQGSGMYLFPAEPFNITAMGRKACVVDPERKTEVRNAQGTAAIRE